MEISEKEYEYLCFCREALLNFARPKCICPRCHEAVILEGYTCMNCGYDYDSSLASD